MGDAEQQWQHVRDMLQMLAMERGHTFGYPLPDEHVPIVVSDRFPLRSMAGYHYGDPHRKTEASDLDRDFELLNSFPSRKHPNLTMLVIRDKRTGKSKLGISRKPNRFEMLVSTLGVACNWSMDAELKAQTKLQQLIGFHKYRQYITTGTFLESSARSGVSYVFRRCRPTIAVTSWHDSIRPICALCLHGVGYYEETFAGAMVPTDDVISHLLLMRGDEAAFWRQCNQHPIESLEAGL